MRNVSANKERAMKIPIFRAILALVLIAPQAWGSVSSVELKDLAGKYQVSVNTWKLANEWTIFNLLIYPFLWVQGAHEFEIKIDSQGWVVLDQPKLKLSCFGLAVVDNEQLKSRLTCEGGVDEITLNLRLDGVAVSEDFTAPIHSSVYAELFGDRWVGAHFCKTGDIDRLMTYEKLPYNVQGLHDQHINKNTAPLGDHHCRWASPNSSRVRPHNAISSLA